MLILNDLHLSAQRRAGTTPKSQEALRSFLFNSVRSTLATTKEQHLLILGDLFDDFNVTPRDWIEAYGIFCDWVTSGKKLTLVGGNHDIVERGVGVSGFEMLCTVLSDLSPGLVQTVMIGQCNEVEPHIYAIAHHSTDEAFHQQLSKLLAKVVPGDRVLLHCNYDCPWEPHDHSLNLTVEQAKEFVGKGATLYFAHEHQAKQALGGSVVIFGNQTPSSIVDCLGNDAKFAHVLNGGCEKIKTWFHDQEVGGFAEVSWRDLDSIDSKVGNADFIRVTGSATREEASLVIDALANFRRSHPAFVIANAIKIDGIASEEGLPDSFEDVKSFDILNFIREQLTPEQLELFNKLEATC